MDIVSSRAQVIVKDNESSSGVNIRSAMTGYSIVLNFWGNDAYLARVKGYSDIHILILPSGKWEGDAKAEGFEIIGRLSDLVGKLEKP
jgi:hypothetical protein